MVTEKIFKKLLYNEFGIVNPKIEKLNRDEITLVHYMGKMMFLLDGDKGQAKGKGGMIRLRICHDGVEWWAHHRYFWDNTLEPMGIPENFVEYEPLSVFDI